MTRPVAADNGDFVHALELKLFGADAKAVGFDPALRAMKNPPMKAETSLLVDLK